MIKPLDLFPVSILLERSETLALLALEAEQTLPLERWKPLFQELANKHLETLQAMDAAILEGEPVMPERDLRQRLWLLENKAYLAAFMREDLSVNQCIALVADQLDSIEAARRQLDNMQTHNQEGEAA
jgi:hypothetical protein